MGAVVAAVAGAVVSSAVAGWVGGAVLIAGTEITVGTIVGAVAGSVVAGAVGAALSDGDQRKRPSSTGAVGARNQGQSVSITATDEPIPVAYGFCTNVPGLIVYRDVAGANNEWLYLIAVASEGEIEAFDATYLDGTLSTDAKFAGLATIECHTGTDAQAASALLLADLPSKWSAADIGGGIAYAVLKLKNDTTAFTRGEPAVTFDLRGRKVKDTRDAGTRFAPNPALIIRDYWTNTRYGRKIAESRMADAKISAEATYFDGRETVPATAKTFTADAATEELTFAEDVPFDNGDGVQLSSTGALPGGTAPATTYYWIRLGTRRGKLATTYANAIARTALDLTDAGMGTHTCTHVDQPRYTANGLLDPSANPYENLERLRSSCRAWLFDAGGQYHLVADKPVAGPYDPWDEDMIVGEWTIDLGGEEGHFNRVEARFLDPMKDHQPNVATSDNATERTADGGKVLLGQLRLEFTANSYMAQRIAQIERRKSRLGLRVTHRVSVEGFQSFVGDVIRHTHSTPDWTDKLYRVMRIAPQFDDELEVDLAEYADAVWTLDAQSAMTLPARTNLPDSAAGLTLAGLALSSGNADLLAAQDGTIHSRIRVTWTAPANPLITDGGFTEVQFRKDADAAWNEAAPVQGALSQTFLSPVQDAVAYRVRARHVNRHGGAGAWVPDATGMLHTVIGKTALPSDVTGAVGYQNGNVVVFGCANVPDADLDLVEVRWLDYGDDTWANGEPVANILRGEKLPSASIPPGWSTFLYKGKDTSGNYSANAARVDLWVTAEGYLTIQSREDAPSWTGTLSHFVVSVSGALIPDSTKLASEHTREELFEQFVPYPQAICTYTAPEMDKGIDGTARVYGEIESQLGPGVVTGTATPKHRIDTKLAAGAYDGFEDWSIGGANFRQLKSQVRLDTAVGKAKITAFQTTIDALARTENGTFTTPAGGSVAVTYATPFHLVPGLQVTPQGSGDVSASFTSVTSAGFDGHFKSGGAAAAGTANYSATGV